ncbi:MAG: preprotein translocase subunit SecE [Flavobacteriales bacterium]|nr:preprotein translocase subunit SecE [Flavobacteriales bacterium]
MAGIKTFIEESYNELLYKVTWPTWAELQESTVLVFITMFILTVIIYCMDFIFGVQGGPDSFWRGALGWLYQLLT